MSVIIYDICTYIVLYYYSCKVAINFCKWNKRYTDWIVWSLSPCRRRVYSSIVFQESFTIRTGQKLFRPEVTLRGQSLFEVRADHSVLLPRSLWFLPYLALLFRDASRACAYTLIFMQNNPTEVDIRMVNAFSLSTIEDSYEDGKGRYRLYRLAATHPESRCPTSL